MQKIINAIRESRKPTLPAQGLFTLIARASGKHLTPRTAPEIFRMASETIRALVESGELSYEFAPDGGTYRINHHAPEEVQGVEPNRRFNGDSLHLQAAQIMASREFTPNAERVQEAKRRLGEGLVYSGGEWLSQPDYERKLTIDAFDEAENDALNERKTFRELVAIQSWIVDQLSTNGAPAAKRFPVKCDDRGRFYYKGGFLSPHNGRFARWLYTHEGEATYDHRTSFAQMISIILGDDELGRQVGITSDQEGDFYVGLARDAELEIDRHGIDREAMKRAIMPAAYGAGERLSRARFEKVYTDHGAEVNSELWEVVAKSLKNFAHLQSATRAFAHGFADDGETPEWLTPSGFTAKKHYWLTRTVTTVFDTEEENSWFRPQTMKAAVPTRIVCTQSAKAENGQPAQKSAIVATMANMVQSLDAALMAHVIVGFYEQTGEALYPIHDSYTVSAEHAETLQTVVRDSLRAIARSDALANLRKAMHLPPVRVQTGTRPPKGAGRVLDMRKMLPIEAED